jgi:hypothetical protein
VLEDDLPDESKKMEVVDGGGPSGVFASPTTSGPSTSSPNDTFTDVAQTEARDVDSFKRMLGDIYAETSPCDEEDLTWFVGNFFFFLEFFMQLVCFLAVLCVGKYSRCLTLLVVDIPSGECARREARCCRGSSAKS